MYFKLTKNFVLILPFLLLGQSCIKDNFVEVTNPKLDTSSVNEIDQLIVPEDFEFNTHDQITITINDDTANVKYDVYAYNDTQYVGDTFQFINDEGQPDTSTEFKSDILNHLLFTGITVNGLLEHKMALPTYYDKIYIRRKNGFQYSSEIINIESNRAYYIYNGKSDKNTSSKTVIDYLLCVNGSAELFQINPFDGSFTYLSDMPHGSFTAATDQANGFMYSIGRSSPYPLMRYDILNDSWEIMGNVGRGGPRLEFNAADGLLYFSTQNKLYTIDPNNANTISNWTINGLHNTSGGDIAFSSDGTVFMCTFSGLYRLDIDSSSEYQSTRISADNLPFQPTSMTFDKNDELWLANNASNSDLIIMDTQTGGWQYNYGPNSQTDITFDRTINDLTTFKIIDDEAIDPDTDGDGIKDSNDSFPTSAGKAFEQFTPSKYGWGTVAFEDLWPSLGDYDFNDTAVNYRFVAVLNAQNKAVQLDIHYQVTSDGAGLTNAFGIEFENLSPLKVASVTGLKLQENYIEQASNGLEANQENAVVILFDNHGQVVNQLATVSIFFTEPITTAELGNAPFNPFLIAGKRRTHEIHLPNKKRTSLGQELSESSNINDDFKTDTGLPWAINIIHDFKVPKEKISIMNAYNNFANWAETGGNQNLDWYKDNPGNRNANNIKL